VAHQCARRRAGLRHGAALRLSGAAHQQAQRRNWHQRHDAPSPRAEPSVSERAALAAGAAPGSGSDRPGRPAWPDHLQMRQQPAFRV